MAKDSFTEPTTGYWQEILPAERHSPTAPFQYSYAARLPDSRILKLPIRALSDDEAIASLIINQAAFDVTAELGAFLADAVRPFNPDVVVGLPTLGLSLAPIVAQHLGHKRYIPLSHSRKFWYSDALSTEVSSITSPTGPKKLYLDPNLVPLLEHRKVVMVDDATSSGQTLAASWDLLEKVAGCAIVGCGVVMKQGERWRARLGAARAEQLVCVLESPLLRSVEGGWQ